MIQVKRIYSIERLCLDCKLCEVACKTAHSKSGNIVKAYKFEKPAPVSRMQVEGNLLDSIAVQCRHCDNPKCVEACITHAMTKDPETGIVSVDEDRCIGCLTCVAACPYGCIIPSDVALKCDMCINRVGGEPGKPACVEACPNRALVIEDVEAM